MFQVWSEKIKFRAIFFWIEMFHFDERQIWKIWKFENWNMTSMAQLGTRWHNQLGRQVLKHGILGLIPTEDEPLTTTRKHYPNSKKKLIPKK